MFGVPEDKITISGPDAYVLLPAAITGPVLYFLCQKVSSIQLLNACKCIQAHRREGQHCCGLLGPDFVGKLGKSHLNILLRCNLSQQLAQQSSTTHPRTKQGAIH